MKTWQDREEFKRLFTEKAYRLWEKELQELTLNEVYQTIAYMIRDLVSEDWIRTNQSYAAKKVKQVYYFSIEFLMGRLLESNLLNVDMDNICRDGLKDLGWDLEDVIPAERDPGLGNGGLGRLAACFIDSLAALSLPGHGNSIRYQYGLFNQRIVDNQQVELPDNWLSKGYPWEVKKVDKAVYVRFGGNAYMRLRETVILNAFMNSSRRSRPSPTTCRSLAVTMTRSIPCACGGPSTLGKKSIRNCPWGTATGPSAIKTVSSRFRVSSILTIVLKTAAACA